MSKSSKLKAKSLHLAKFAPIPKAQEAVDPAASEGETVFIRRTTEAVVESKLQPQGYDSSEFSLPLQVMLGIITYCYARGVFNSSEIAALLKGEPAMRKAFGSILPEETEIRRFRRKFASEIEDALETLYLAFPRRDPAVPEAPADKPEKPANKQAAERVHDAMWADNKLPGRPIIN